MVSYLNSLSTWTLLVNCVPGLFYVKRKVDKNPISSDCALKCGATMSIKATVFCNKSSDSYKGYTNFKEDIGRKALVFRLIGFRDK